MIEAEDLDRATIYTFRVQDHGHHRHSFLNSRKIKATHPENALKIRHKGGWKSKFFVLSASLVIISNFQVIMSNYVASILSCTAARLFISVHLLHMISILI